jgi:hypothetical protein
VQQVALAFYQTYGIKEDFTGQRGRRINVSAYRFAVRGFLPRIAYAVTLLHRSHEPADPDTPDAHEMEAEAAQVATENNWQAYRRKAGIGTYTLAGLLFILPKVGALKMVAVKGPTAETEAEYLHSVATSVAALRRTLAGFTPPAAPKTSSTGGEAPGPEVKKAELPDQPARPVAASLRPKSDGPKETRDPKHPLPNRDLDTGKVVQPGGYSLTDSTFAHLLHVLTRQPTEPIPPGIKEEIQAYYANLDLPITTKKDPQQWAQVLADLDTLKTMPTSTAPEPFPTYGDEAAGGQ